MQPGARRVSRRLPLRAALAGAILLADIVAAVGCHRGNGVADPQTWRLLDGGEALAAAGAPLDGVAVEPSPDSRIGGDVRPPGRAARIVMAREGHRGYDARVALLAVGGTEYRYRLEVPARAVLRLGLGHPHGTADPAANLAAGAPEGRGRFVVAVEPAGGKREPLLDETIAVRDEDEWRDHALDLSRWSGSDVTLVLSTEAPPGQLLAWSAPEVDTAESKPQGWDVILISLDTLRADHLGAYGYQRPTSPNLDALAREGVLFKWAIAQAPWTRPSHLAMFTGLYPVEAGAAPTPTLAETLRRHGYRTTALTGAGQIDYRFEVFARGFESYRASRWNEHPEWVTQLLAARRARPDLLFLHTYKVHDPYEEHDFVDDFARGRIGESFGKRDWQALGHKLDGDEQRYVTALYDGGVALADRQVGEVMRQLRAAGLLDRTIVVVTSDHGEQLWEHGSWRHGMNMYEHQLHVPLIVRLPPPLMRELAKKRGDRTGRGLVIDRQVQSIDIYPTIVDLLGLPVPEGLRGRSLRPLLEGKPAEELTREAFAENTNISTWERKALRTERFKFIVSIPRGPVRKKRLQRYYELYDLRRDPREQVNLAKAHPDVVQFLAGRMQAIRQTAHAGKLQEELPANVDDELKAQLKALGYGN